MSEPLSSRLATPADIPTLKVLMERSISLLSPAFLSPEEVTASHEVMGLDTQLIADGTYFVIEADRAITGSGGWSRRATLFGGDHTRGRDAALLNPATEGFKSCEMAATMGGEPLYAACGYRRIEPFAAEPSNGVRAERRSRPEGSRAALADRPTGRRLRGP